MPRPQYFTDKRGRGGDVGNFPPGGGYTPLPMGYTRRCLQQTRLYFSPLEKENSLNLQAPIVASDMVNTASTEAPSAFLFIYNTPAIIISPRRTSSVCMYTLGSRYTAGRRFLLDKTRSHGKYVHPIPVIVWYVNLRPP